ncbi:phosphate-starvation-inducible PsiE family protein [Weissella tructae]|jgi:protein PsiE|uniref:Protein PsiE n=2 Tax=Weissella TaxID=46255 RepID=A0A075TY77_9LACO|nr:MULTISPECIES: phosphate-starvation-inducible PsiE family protein [Weissella]AIG65291.1 PsiE protein [Weissella tructae]AIM62604.1 PsiE protein [Weissella ceti]AIM63940.1 PsiE protein [Weissella ceti]ELA07693.1 hypothetical protein WCNC_01780 [Weissella ceti NC36]QVV91672.1 phosphate-starvation-inducible PsiE family protein [Weissella tructae]
MKKIVTGFYEHTLEWGMLALGVILLGFFFRDTFLLAQMVFTANMTADFYAISELVLETFLFFEFVVLTREYFITNHISLTNFMYIGITAMLRNLLVNHANATEVLIQAFAIVVLLLGLMGYLLVNQRLTNLKHADERDTIDFEIKHEADRLKRD